MSRLQAISATETFSGRFEERHLDSTRSKPKPAAAGVTKGLRIHVGRGETEIAILASHPNGLKTAKM